MFKKEFCSLPARTWQQTLTERGIKQKPQAVHREIPQLVDRVREHIWAQQIMAAKAANAR